MIGQTVSHYRITRQLGAGGMGVVYEALDLDLQVPRALKFLPSVSSPSEEDQRRLTREARAAAVLEHPSICPVHEIGHDRDQTFIVMSYLEGQTIAERLEDSKSLPLDQALNITREIGEALSLAHGAGVIHRDIKPANVMLTGGGKAVVMDFGLAFGSDLSRVTKTGTTLGTAAYMSPEQARGDQVDSRTDIWSLGVVLYEMLTGTVPFGGDHLAAVAYAVQHREPDPPLKLQPGLPPDMNRILGRALAKDPSQRYQSVEDFLSDLAAMKQGLQVDRQTMRHDLVSRFKRSKVLVSVVLAAILLAAAVAFLWPRPASIRSLAVLPFANLSGDPEQEYLAAGMTDDLIIELSRLTNLPRVISRQTIMKYRNSELTLQEIAQELQVDAIVESSLLQTGNRIKASFRLIEAGTEETLWVDTYEQPLDSILGLYGQVTRSVAQAIDLELSPLDKGNLESTPEVDPAAYEAYLRGRFWMGRDKELETAEKSAAFFEEALALDPNFAPAWAGLAQIHSNMKVLTCGTVPEHTEKAREAASRALELDPNSAESRAVLASIHMLIDMDWAAASNQWSRISARDRERVEGYAAFLCFSARFDEAIAWSRELLAKDPMSKTRLDQLGMSLRFARRFEEAIPVLENFLEYYPEDYWGKYSMAVSLERTGRHEEALAVFPGMPTSSDVFIPGDRARVQSGVRDLLNQVEKSGSLDEAFHLSRHFAWLGDREQALAWLKTASEESPDQLFVINVVQEFDFLRSEPEFMDCMRRAGFTEEIVEASKALTSDSAVGDIWN